MQVVITPFHVEMAESNVRANFFSAQNLNGGQFKFVRFELLIL